MLFSVILRLKAELFSWAAAWMITPIRLQPPDEGPPSLSGYTKGHNQAQFRSIAIGRNMYHFTAAHTTV